MKVADFFIALGVDLKDQDAAKLDGFIKAMGKLDVKAIAAVSGLGAVYLGLQKIMQQSLKTGMSLFHFSQQLGLSTEELQKWSFFAEQMGGSVEDVESSIRAISSATAQIRLGQGNIAPFQMLGISPTDNPFKILEELRTRLKGLDPQIARLITSQLGLSESMLTVLKVSDEQFELMNKQFFLNEKQIKSLVSLQRAWKSVTRGFLNIISIIGTQLAPIFENLIFFLKDIGKWMSFLFNKVKFLKTAFIALGAALGIIFAPVATALAGILLAIDDIYTAIRGGQSFTSMLAEDLAAPFKTLVENIKKAKENIKEFFEGFKKYSPANLFNLQGLKPASGFLAPLLNKQTPISGGNNTVTIHIDGAQDPITIGNIVSDQINKIFKHSAYQTPRENR